ncbi:MAG: hypothetical protein Q9181_000237 [Wetmoreana brouardii]
MGDDYLRIREKENAKEWQMKEDAGVHKGNIYNYFNQYIEDDQTSESAAEEPTLPQPRPSTSNFPASSRPHAPTRTALPTVISKKLPGRPATKRTITLATKKDNAAKAAWRNNKEPSKSYDIKSALKDIEPNVAKLQRILEEIGVRLGSFLSPQRSLNGSRLLVWGDPKQVQLTVDELERWRQRTGTPSSEPESRARDAFAKIYSTIGQTYATDEKTARRHAMRQRYQKKPQPGQTFKSNGYFLWPNDEIRAIDLFGPNCEALDALRMDYKAHVLFDESRSVFKVHSDIEDKLVNEVIQRIENTIKEYVARDNRPILVFSVEPPSLVNYRNDVQTVPGPLLGLNQTQSRIPTLCAKKLQLLSVAKWERDANHWNLKNESRMYTAVHSVLKRIPYYRGHLRMRVNLGMFTLVKFQWPPGVPSVTLDKFTNDIQQAGTRGAIVRDLQAKRLPRDILDFCNHANNLFQPLEPTKEDLAKVLPQYSALFYLRHPEKLEEMIELEVSFKPNEADPGSFESAKAMWRRGGKPDALSQAPPLEIFNIRLHSGISWELRISTESTLDPSRITPQMEAFANGVEYKHPSENENPALSGFKVFTSPPNLRILGMEQKTTFKYCLKAQPRYVFELSRYDEYNGNSPWHPSSTQWAASFYDRDWDDTFGENAKLGVGEAASWNPHINPFFRPIDPEAKHASEAGFKDFLSHTKALGRFLDGLQATPEDTGKANGNSK